MDSLYGGRPGAPFVIRGTFKSIEEMQKAFKKGPDYKEIWYGEYCIIDTPNKNSFDNGKVFQRGTEYANADGDPKYVGQIVGPQSGVPAFEMTTLEDVKSYAKGHDDKGRKFPVKDQGEPGYETRTWPYQKDEKTVDLYQDWAENVHGNDKEIKIKTFTLKDRVAGAERDDSYRIKPDTIKDDIEYSWVNIAYPYGTSDDPESGEGLFASAKTLVGFKTPYPVEGFTVSSKLPYTDNEAGIFEDPTRIYEEPSTVGHPYAYQWNITLPAGIKGESIRNLRILTRAQAEDARDHGGYKVAAIYVPSDIKVTSELKGSRYDYKDATTASTFNGDNIDAWKNHSATNAQFWFCDVYMHDAKRNGDKYLVYLGEAEKLSRVDLEDTFTQTGDGKLLTATTTNTGRTVKGTLNETLDLYSDIGIGHTNHLYALFSAKSDRAQDKNGTDGYAQGFQSKLYPNVNTKAMNWRDLGVIKDESGLLIGHNLGNDEKFMSDGNKASRQAKETILAWLNENYKLKCLFDENKNFERYEDPNNKDLQDSKVVSYTTGTTTYFYAWDYSYLPTYGKDNNAEISKWYFLGAWNGSIMVSEDGKKPDSAMPGDWFLPITSSNVHDAREKNWWES